MTYPEQFEDAHSLQELYKFGQNPPQDTSRYLGMSKEIFNCLLQIEWFQLSEQDFYGLASSYPYLQAIDPEDIRKCLMEEPLPMASNEEGSAEVLPFSLEDVSDETLFQMFGYAMGRLPRELLDGECSIVFDATYNVDRSNRKLLPPKRNRAYYLEEDYKGKKKVILELRTVTDLYENISCLAVLAAVRRRGRQLYFNEYESDPSGGNAEDKELSFSKRFDRMCDHVANNAVPGFTRDDGIRFCGGQFSLNDAVGELPSLSKLGKAEAACVHSEQLVRMAKEAIGENEAHYPHVVFFSNTFTYKQIMAHPLLEEAYELEDGDKMRLYDYLYRTVTELIGPDIPRKLQDAREFLEDYSQDNEEGRISLKSLFVSLLQDEHVVTFLVNTDTPPPKNIAKAMQEFANITKSKRFLRSIGLRSIIDPRNSPTSEEVLYINTAAISDEIMKGLDPVFQREFAQLKDLQFRIIMLPYALGELSAFLLNDFSKEFNIQGVMEMGKIGHLAPDYPGIVGSPVITTHVTRMGNGEDILAVNPVPYGNEIVSMTAEAPAVLLQTPEDLVGVMKALGKLVNAQGVAVEMAGVGMEHFNLVNMARRLRIPCEIFDYVSDVVLGDRRISKESLGLQGIPCTMHSFLNVTKFLVEISALILDARLRLEMRSLVPISGKVLAASGSRAEKEVVDEEDFPEYEPGDDVVEMEEIGIRPRRRRKKPSSDDELSGLRLGDDGAEQFLSELELPTADEAIESEYELHRKHVKKAEEKRAKKKAKLLKKQRDRQMTERSKGPKAEGNLFYG